MVARQVAGRFPAYRQAGSEIADADPEEYWRYMPSGRGGDCSRNGTEMTGNGPSQAFFYGLKIMTPSASPFSVFLSSGRLFASLARRQFFALPFLMLAAGVFESVGIVLFFPLLDRLQIGGSGGKSAGALGVVTQALHAMGLETLGGILFFIVVVFLLKFAVLFAQDVAIQKITRDLYRTVVDRLLLGWSGAEYVAWLQRTSAGQFSNMVTRELWTFLGAFAHYCGILVGFLYIITYLTLAVLLDARVTAIAAIGGVLLLFFFRRFTKATRAYSLAMTKEDERFHGAIIEFAQFFKYLKATHRFPTMIAAIRATVRRTTHLRFRMGLLGGFVGALPEPIAVLFVAVFIFVEVALFGRPFSVIVVLLLLFYRTLMRLLTLQSSWQKFFGCSGALAVIRTTLETTATHAERSTGVTPMALAEAITLRDVSFQYDTRPILTQVSLTFAKNTTTAIVGSSGAGKSTIVDLVTGVLKPTAGSIFFDATPYSVLNVALLRLRIGYVAQEITMFNDTIAANVSFWDDGEATDVRERVRIACDRASCDFLRDLPFGDATPVGDRGVSLSVGQRQRLAIARELYRNPEILIFDEATSALDSESEQAIQRSMEAMRGTKTMIVIAHRLSTIRHADRIIVLENGRVVEEGAFQGLYDNTGSRFYRMCEQQSFS